MCELRVWVMFLPCVKKGSWIVGHWFFMEGHTLGQCLSVADAFTSALGRTQVPFHMFLNDCSHLSGFHRQATRWCVGVCVCSFCMKAVILCCVLWQAYFDSDVATRSAEQLAPDVPVLSNSNSLPSCGSVLPAPESMQLTQVCDLSSILPLNHWALVSEATSVWYDVTSSGFLLLKILHSPLSMQSSSVCESRGSTSRHVVLQLPKLFSFPFYFNQSLFPFTN